MRKSLPRKVRVGKPNRHEKVCQVLLSGKAVSPDEIRSVFKGTDQEDVLYRLSTNIYNIRRDGGVIKVHKDGRKVTGYQLMNPQDFSPEGRFVAKTLQVKNQPVEVEVQEETKTEVTQGA